MKLGNGILVAAAVLAVGSEAISVRGGSSGASGPALNPNLVVSATGSPGMIVSEAKLNEHLASTGNFTAFDQDELHAHVVSHYKDVKSTPLEVTPDIVGNDDEKETETAVKILQDEDKSLEEEDREIDKLAAEKSNSLDEQKSNLKQKDSKPTTKNMKEHALKAGIAKTASDDVSRASKSDGLDDGGVFVEKKKKEKKKKGTASIKQESGKREESAKSTTDKTLLEELKKQRNELSLKIAKIDGKIETLSEKSKVSPDVDEDVAGDEMIAATSGAPVKTDQTEVDTINSESGVASATTEKAKKQEAVREDPEAEEDAETGSGEGKGKAKSATGGANVENDNDENDDDDDKEEAKEEAQVKKEVEDSKENSATGSGTGSATAPTGADDEDGEDADDASDSTGSQSAEDRMSVEEDKELEKEQAENDEAEDKIDQTSGTGASGATGNEVVESDS